MYPVLLVIHTILVIFLILMVLVQRSDSDGLSGLGGGGGNQFLTGRGAANLLTRTTAVLAGLFMLTSLVLAIMASRMSEHSILDTVPAEQTAPLTTGAPANDNKAAPAAKEQAPAKTKPAVPATKNAVPEKAPATPAVPKPE